MHSLLLLILLFSILAFPAWAGDGVLEINQACAVQTGCFAGDTAGLPVTIDGSAGKSYRLTGDLVVPDENTDGIFVSADNVSIDLAGFEIRGPVVCSGSPLTCTPDSGGGSGVERSSGITGTTVRNGSIRGMGNRGVLLGDHSEVTNVRVGSNRVDGISVAPNSIVSGNTAYRNGDDGISASVASIVSGNTTYQNRLFGINAAAGSSVLGNTARQNGASGINCNAGSTCSGNTAYENGSNGIVSGPGATVSENTVRLNSGFGLSLGSGSGYRANVISSNTGGTVTGGVDIGDNLCDESTTCP